MALKVLDALRRLPGYGIARRIEQVSEQVLQSNGGWKTESKQTTLGE